MNSLNPWIISFLICFLLIDTFNLEARTYDFKKDFGAVGDGKTDNSKVWSDVVAFFNKEKKGHLFIPAGVYRIGKQIIDENPNNGIPYASLAYGKLTFSDIDGLVIEGEVDKEGKPSTIFKYLDGVKYGYFNPTNGKEPINVSKDAQAIGGVVMSFAWNCKNITVRNLELDGNFNRGTYYPAPKGKRGVDLIFIGISSYGVQNFNIHNVNVHHFGLDGLYIQTPRTELSENNYHAILDQCTASYNGRQGLSFTVGSNLKVVNSRFEYTGMGGIRISPGANVDIENHDKTGKHLTNVWFENCVITSNKGGSGSVNLAGRVKNIVFKECTIDAGEMIDGTNRAYAIQMNFSPSRRVKFENCIIKGVFLMHNRSGKKMDEDGITSFIGCTFEDNLPSEITKSAQPLIDIYDKVKFQDCKFYVHPARTFMRSSFLNKNDIENGVVLIQNSKVYNSKTKQLDNSHLEKLSKRFSVRP